MILPSPPFLSDGKCVPNWEDRFSEYLRKFITEGIDINKKFFDIKLSKEAIDNIRITIGPHSSKSDHIIVESLLMNYSKNGIVKNSELCDDIRN
ncbi:MAG: hypothetical protein C0412_12660 [Flavobacterium sp.]|nr:hypothetical protein [Flavobacterium sp.]